MIRRVYIIPLSGSQEAGLLDSERVRVGNIFNTDRQKVIMNRATEAGEATLDVLVNVDTFADLDNSANKVTTLTTSATAPLVSVTQSPGDNSTKVATTAYVDAAVIGPAVTLSEVLTNGNTTGANDIYINTGRYVRMVTGTYTIKQRFNSSDWYVDALNSATSLNGVLTVSSFDASVGIWSSDGVNASQLVNYVDYGLITSDKATYQGYKYAADYSANYTARSLIDKGYAAATYSAIAGSSSIVTVGTITTGTWNASLIGLAYGGTNKNMTAVNGGIVWTDADSMEVSAAGSSGQILRSGGAAVPTWSTATYPATATGTGTILRADGTNWVATTNTYPTTTTANQVLYATGTNVIGSGTGLTYDALTLAVSGATNSAIQITATSTGTTGYSAIYPYNSTNGAYISYTAYGSAVPATSAGLNRTGMTEISMNPQTGGVGLINVNTNFPLVFGTNNTARARFLSTGELVLGAATAISSGEIYSMQKAQNGGTYCGLTNTTSGTAGHVAYIASNSGTFATYGALFSFSAAYTTSGMFVADTAVLYTNKAAGMNVGTGTATQLSLWTNNAKIVEVSAVGNVSIGGVATRGTTVGTFALQIFDGTAPVGTLTNGCSFYSTAGEMRVMDAAGNATLLSPHEKETNYWIYDSVDTTTGKRLKIDMEQFMRWLNNKFGTDFVHEYTNRNN